MINDTFEWDDAKAAINLSKHGVSFGAACGVFADAFALEFEDDRTVANEQRFVTIGVVDGHILVVISTPRGERIRIISARSAGPRERRRYHEYNAD